MDLKGNVVVAPKVSLLNLTSRTQLGALSEGSCPGHCVSECTSTVHDFCSSSILTVPLSIVRRVWACVYLLSSRLPLACLRPCVSCLQMCAFLPLVCPPEKREIHQGVSPAAEGGAVVWILNILQRPMCSRPGPQCGSVGGWCGALRGGA